MSSATLLYDQDCGFCRWSVDRILAWDRGGDVRAVALQSDEADLLLHDVEPLERMRSAHLVSAEGRVYSAGALVDPLLRRLPGGGPFATVARMLPGTTERVYGLVARNRRRLGRMLGTTACTVDPGGGQPGGVPNAWNGSGE